MTLRIPKWFLMAVLAVGLVAGVGVGGYVLGRESRSDAVHDAAALKAQNAAFNEDLPRFGARLSGMHRRLCKQVARLNPTTQENESTCITSTAEPKNGYALNNIDDRMTEAVRGMCELLGIALERSASEGYACVAALPLLKEARAMADEIDELAVQLGEP